MENAWRLSRDCLRNSRRREARSLFHPLPGSPRPSGLSPRLTCTGSFQTVLAAPGTTMGVTLQVVRVERDHPSPGSYGPRTVRSRQFSRPTPAGWLSPHDGARQGRPRTFPMTGRRRCPVGVLRVRRISDYTLWGGAALLSFDPLSDGRDLTEEPYRPLLRN